MAQLPSTEGRLDLLSPLLGHRWWKRGCGFILLSGHRLSFFLTNRCHIKSCAAVPRAACWAGALSLEEAARQHALPSPGAAPGSMLGRDGSSLPWAVRPPCWDVGVPCCPHATCSLHAACQAPVSCSPASLLLAG